MFQKLVPFVADLWPHRGLLWQFTLRNVEVRHRGSHLGLVWSFLNPLVLLGFYVLVFGYIFGGKFGILPNETRVDYAIGIFLGLTIFHFVAEVLSVAPSLIVMQPNFVKKVVFPLEILPAANVGAAGFHMLVSLMLVLLIVSIFGAGMHWEALWLVVILALVTLLALGISWLFSAFGVFLRDIGQVMQVLTMGLMFSSAVFYSAHNIPAPAWHWMRFNPVLLAVELARDVVLWQRPINFTHLLYLAATSLAACQFGYFVFRRMKPTFADVL